MHVDRLPPPPYNSAALGFTVADSGLMAGNKTLMAADSSFNGGTPPCLNWSEGQNTRSYSFGVFLENPLSFTFPVIMLEIVLVTFTSRIVFFLLRPLHQPRIVCDILAGILVGPEILGNIFPAFYNEVFPVKEIMTRSTLGVFGLLFYIFVISVKTDSRIDFRSGGKSIFIGVASIVVPVSVITAGYFAFRSRITTGITSGKLLVFLATPISMTNYIVVADILSELQLLNSELGRLAMSAAVVNVPFGMSYVALMSATRQSQGGLDKALLSLASFAAMVVVILLVFRRWMNWIVRQIPRGGAVSGGQLYSIVLCVMAAVLVCDAFGMSIVMGPLLMGLVVPEGPPLGAALLERIGEISNEVLLPLLFALAGSFIKTEAVASWRSWSEMGGFVVIAFGLKMAATMAPAIYCRATVRDAFILGLIMNLRGLVELILFLNMRNASLLNDENYSLLVFSILITTSISTTLVRWLYNPMGHQLVGRRGVQHLNPTAELRILACVRSEEPIPAIINLLEASSSSEQPSPPLCVYVLHLVELIGRSNSTLIAHKNRKGFVNPSHMDRLHNAFINYEQDKKGAVVVQPFTSVSPVKTMHQDICSLAGEKNAAIVIFPFPANSADHAFRCSIPDILRQAPCTVGQLVQMGALVPVLSAPVNFRHHVGLLFWGGPDDREALAYAARMVRHAGVSLKVTRIISPTAADDGEAQLDGKEAQEDSDFIEAFQRENEENERVLMDELAVDDVEHTIAVVRNFGRGGYDLVVIGRRRAWNSLLDEGLEEWSEFRELGIVGDMLASSEAEYSFSILVVQHRSATWTESLSSHMPWNCDLQAAAALTPSHGATISALKIASVSILMPPASQA
ncbi:Cation/H(+) antiporter 15 [Apostasia shenzhenica]|uniref:Cation/H(+) antiporter 15 n=1 Tax=Apostasia shenzhenica TaxID=1088818 RepID=A0A2I0AIL1_9ASPA|nr:Cation/H(+) antiporter 15 [Apostasia shenzhenica]